MRLNVAEVDAEVVEHVQGTATVRARFDMEMISASTAVIATLADVLDIDPVELDSLYSVVDPDALDTLFDTRMSSDLHITFPHENHVITVHGHGVVTVTPEPDLAGATSGDGAGR